MHIVKFKDINTMSYMYVLQLTVCLYVKHITLTL